MSPSIGIRVDVTSILSHLLSYCIISSAVHCLLVRGSNCKYEFSNGSIIDLTPISPKEKALFFDIQATGPSKDTSKYSYNPCFNFKEGDGECQSGVAVCQKHEKNEYLLGCAERGVFLYEEATKELFLTYNENQRKTKVSLICSRSANKPEFKAIGESIPGESKLYLMKLTTRCACADECIEENSGLSTGSVLVIMFFVFAAVYFFGGMAYLKIVRGASGTEMVPNYDFWIDFPLLVRDGVIFLLNCCRAETTYERI